MPIQRKERIIILGLGTLGFILTVVGAGFDYWLDGVTLGITIFGIVVESIGMMMMATFIVKEYTKILDSITCLNSRIWRIGGVLTAFGSIIILISLLVHITIKANHPRKDARLQVGFSWWLMFIGVWLTLFSGSIDLCNHYCTDDNGNVADDSENTGDENANVANDNANVGNEMDDMVNDLEVRNDRENVGNEEEDMRRNMIQVSRM